MTKMTISLYGRDYHVACAPGEEKRVRQLASYVDQKMHEVAANAGNTTEVRLFMLACMMMADEIAELVEQIQARDAENEDTLVGVISKMHDRLSGLVQVSGQA